MKLDSRIIEGMKPLGVFDTEEAKRFIGKGCYFANAESVFSNIDDNPFVAKGILTSIDENSEYAFHSEGTLKSMSVRHILPCEWVKETEWRPFSLTEWRHNYSIGDEIVFRMKDSDTVRVFMYCGLYSDHDDDLPGKGVINLGGELFVLQNLFDLYELREDNEWQPFGIEIEE